MGTGEAEGKDEGEGKGMDGPKHTSAYSAAGASTPGPTVLPVLRQTPMLRQYGQSSKICGSLKRTLNSYLSRRGLSFETVRVAGAGRTGHASH